MGDLNTPHLEHYFTWIQSGTFNIGCDFLVDRLTIVMLLVVTGIGSLIHIYSIGYMAHEHGTWRLLPVLRLPEPLHVLHAGAGAGRQLTCCSSSAGKAWACAATC